MLSNCVDQTSQADQMYMFLVDCELYILYGAKLCDDQKTTLDELQECVQQELNQLIAE
jgi:hypothetical protein